MTAAQRIDSWPRTRRPLPWLFAIFLAAIFLVPVDAVHLKVHLPFSSDLDRFLVAIILVVWAGGVLVRGPGSRLRLRPRGWALPVLIFFGLAVLSIVLNIGRITNLGEFAVAEKRLALLVSLVAVFAVFAVSLRVTELRAFATLIVVLATITSLGTIYEQKTGDNLFYSTASSVLSPIAEVEPAPTEQSPASSVPGRPLISGPTRHALSVASLLGMALPFAVAFAAMSTEWRRRLLWGLLACLILAGALVTQRRSGVIVPAVALAALFAIRPRKMAPLLPYAIVAIAVGLVLSGGTISAVNQLFNGGDNASTEGRTSDYAAVVPDLLTHPAIGRGYGTLNSIKVDTYRIFDNEYLGTAYQMGLLGLLAFVAMILAPVFIVRNVARSDNPLRGPPALGAAAGCLAFAVATGLYDILSFPQAPYLFFFLAAMCTTAASVEKVAPAEIAASRLSGARGRRRVEPARPVVEPA
ncbi:MAG TPA: O-antigen ligase family protein [Solirubrobacterales bacterium]|nr:O-antigen ligase family protein [Solirubrobacterales bacterium]